MTTMPPTIAEPAGDDPAHATQRRREEHLEPAGRLVGRPAADERRRGEAGQDQPELDEERAGGSRRRCVMSMPGKTLLEEPLEVRRRSELLGERAVRTPRSTSPKSPSPMPHASAVGRLLADRPADRTAEADEGPRQARRRDRRSSPRGRAGRTPRCRARSRTIATSGDREQRRPVELAGERQVVRRPAEPGQVRERRERRDGGLVAVEDEPAEHDGAGDRRPPRPAEERREREGDASPAASASSAEPERVADGGRDARSRRPGSVAKAAPAISDRDEDHDHRDRDARRHVAGQLLERDPAPRHRRRRRRTRGCPAAPRRRACRTARGSTRG